MLTLNDLSQLVKDHSECLAKTVAEFELGTTRFASNSKRYLMGVVNLSPDSWYRESVRLTTDHAIQSAHVQVAQGAHLIDLGAESTLANAARVGEEEQCGRLLPIVRELTASNVLVSVETYHPTVTRRCLEAGARVLNLTGTDRSDEMFRMVAAFDAAVIICHVQGPHVRAVGDFDFGSDPTAMLYEYFSRQIELATRNGVRKLWIDPGLGFYYRNLGDSAVRIRHQMKTFLNTFRLLELGYPICHALPHAFECFREEVRCAEPFFAVLAALGRTHLFRTHEVSKVRSVLETMEQW